jgi:hypothetical protein
MQLVIILVLALAGCGPGELWDSRHRQPLPCDPAYEAQQSREGVHTGSQIA